MRLWQDWHREMLQWRHLEEQLLVGVDGKWPGGRGSVGHHEVLLGIWLRLARLGGSEGEEEIEVVGFLVSGGIFKAPG
ncbi:hypothetical protein CRG98_017516 [Punica granatum]|uniref:Uncharacterized protein n=1 Tax=Punica granatum TaxID=22663 RepID=A0A2I0K214_PUNGR|nr:hypothetical protein CRG98_017516 [Punica granatum]